MHYEHIKLPGTEMGLWPIQPAVVYCDWLRELGFSAVPQNHTFSQAFAAVVLAPYIKPQVTILAWVSYRK